MKIAYGTYAMPLIRLESVIPMLAQMGYDGVEICIGSNHLESMPDKINATRRKELKQLLQHHHLSVPAFMVLGHILEADEQMHQNNLELIRQVAQLARDLDVGETPVIARGIGGKSDLWQKQRNQIVQRFMDYAELASAEGFIIAGEAHCGAAVDRSERAIWIIETVDSPSVGLHFDIVHFYLAGERIEDSVKNLVPITVHTHITDAKMYPNGQFDFLPLGRGELDSITYLKAMHKAGWTDFITLEVSARVWSAEGYDPVQIAALSYSALNNAFKIAGVCRT